MWKENLLLDILIYISNKMECYTVHFIWKLLYMIRVVVTHHQERKQLNLQHLVFVTLYTTHSTLKPFPTLPRLRRIAVTV
jgi:hypothetical protein